MGRYHASESFNDESSVDDRALCRTTHFFLISVCTDQFVLVGAACFFTGSSCLALVSESAVAMQVVVSERLS